MVMIEYKGLQASWSSKSQKWTSTDEQFAKVLNRNLPNKNEITVDIPFRIGGMDKIVLDKIKELLGKALKVVAFFPTLAPVERKEMVY